MHSSSSRTCSLQVPQVGCLQSDTSSRLCSWTTLSSLPSFLYSVPSFTSIHSSPFPSFALHPLQTLIFVGGDCNLFVCWNTSIVATSLLSQHVLLYFVLSSNNANQESLSITSTNSLSSFVDLFQFGAHRQWDRGSSLFYIPSTCPHPPYWTISSCPHSLGTRVE